MSEQHERSPQVAAGGDLPPIDRAVVLVHGIGDQAQGTVLSSWVQQLLDEVRRTEGLRGQLDRVQAGDGPAWADLVLGHPDGPDTATTRVRFYEAFWADVIRPPSYASLVRWSASVLPKVVSHHLLSLVMVWPEQSLADLADPTPLVRLRGAMRAVATVALLPLMLLALTFGAALGLLAVAVVWLLGAVALVPGLRGPAGTVQKVIATSVGDTAYITTNDVQRAYVVDRVKQAINQAAEDLADPAVPVIVAAHSQGAAVSYYALTEGTPPATPVDLLTFGQGLVKVERIRVPLRDAWFVTVPYAMSLATAVAGWLVVRRDAVDGLVEAARVVGLGLVPLVAAALLGLLGRSLLGVSARWVGGGLAVLVLAWWPAVGMMADGIDTAAVVLASLVGLAMFTGAIQLWRHARTRPEDRASDGAVAALTDAVLADGAPAEGLADNATQRSQTAGSKGLRVHLAWPATLRRWTDLWATSDPVPGGALRRPAGAPDGAFTSTAIVNRQSILGDHTSYWDNRQQFLTTVLSRVLPEGWHRTVDDHPAAEVGDDLRRRLGLVNWYARVIGYTTFLAYGLFGPPLPLAVPLTWVPESLREQVAEWTTMSAGRLEGLVMIGLLVSAYRLVTTWLSTRLVDRRWSPRLHVSRPLAEAELDLTDDAPVEAAPAPSSDPVPSPPPTPSPPPATSPPPAAPVGQPADEPEVVFYLDGIPVTGDRRP